jgi:hypothetical protein
MMPATEPLLDVEPVRPDSLAVRIKQIVPPATRQQVGELEELLARLIEDYAGPPKVRPR